ncbi:hypothetical protein DFH29DRAFT_1031385 [Suillus ampliporus]|nr:hypothetical protein DFH29DRAFT_1031385 [Suillus ampliporus]
MCNFKLISAYEALGVSIFFVPRYGFLYGGNVYLLVWFQGFVASWGVATTGQFKWSTILNVAIVIASCWTRRTTRRPESSPWQSVWAKAIEFIRSVIFLRASSTSRSTFWVSLHRSSSVSGTYSPFDYNNSRDSWKTFKAS